MKVQQPLAGMTPVLRWETVIIHAAQHGYTDHNGKVHKPFAHAPHQIENAARRMVAQVLQRAAQGYPSIPISRLPLQDCWGAVISLNFDLSWAAGQMQLHNARSVSGIGTSKISQTEQQRLAMRALMPGVDGAAHRSVWFPNGNCMAPDSIRMGLRDYGAAPHAILAAFAQLKRWERSAGVHGQAPAQQLQICATALHHMSEGADLQPDQQNAKPPTPMPASWVADFLYRPLIFAGVGMSSQEAGLWWLLAQRARNLARAGAPSNAYILLNSNEICVNKLEFWNTKPLGLEPILCTNWSEGWKRIVGIAENLPKKDTKS